VRVWMHVRSCSRSRRAIRWLRRNRCVSRHAHWIHDDNIKLIIEHDQLHQLDNVIDNIKHNNDDNNAIMRYWILYICVGR